MSLHEDQNLETSDMVDWLMSIPALVKFAHIEGIYRSDSTLLVLSVPVAVWNLLLDSLAVSFIGFVRSVNLLKASPLAPERTESKGKKGNDSAADMSLVKKISPVPRVQVPCDRCYAKGIAVFYLRHQPCIMTWLMVRLQCDSRKPFCTRCLRYGAICLYHMFNPTEPSNPSPVGAEPSNMDLKSIIERFQPEHQKHVAQRLPNLAEALRVVHQERDRLRGIPPKQLKVTSIGTQTVPIEDAHHRKKPRLHNHRPGNLPTISSYYNPNDGLDDELSLYADSGVGDLMTPLPSIVLDDLSG